MGSRRSNAGFLRFPSRCPCRPRRIWADLREAFLWSGFRTVTKTATVSLHGNSSEGDPSLAGRRIELVFDPFDLTDIEVRTSGKALGKAVPHHVGRHAHPKASPETPAEPAPSTGIDYLKGDRSNWEERESP
ncbi:Mu transposase C-terminal domain-containing protein [Streptomyces sp. NPDC002159]